MFYIFYLFFITYFFFFKKYIEKLHLIYIKIILKLNNKYGLYNNQIYKRN